MDDIAVFHDACTFHEIIFKIEMIYRLLTGYQLQKINDVFSI